MRPVLSLLGSARAVLLLVPLVVSLAGCSASAPSGAAPSPPSGSSPTPVGSGAGGCVAAPAPPEPQEGWATAAQAPTVFPVIVNSSGSLTCGENRLLFTFLDAENRPVASPDRTVTIRLFNLGRSGEEVVESVTGSFVWGIENERGFYVATARFPEAGRWGAEITTTPGGAAPETIRMTFDVSTSSAVIRVGDVAPASDTPTAASVGGDLARLSTDPKPDPALYGVSVKAAIAAHQPFVLIFATPKFCASAQCGPTLDRIKPVTAEYSSVAFIHVEPYELVYRDGSLQPVLDAQGGLQVIPAVGDWGLLSEPWVFVVDRTGMVTASFEGIVSVDEIRSAADAVK